MLDRIKTRLWLIQYNLEEMRDHAQAERHLWRQACACVGLALLRLWGG